MELLLALGEPAEELCEEFLAHARGRLEEELRSLEADLGPSPPAPDVLEFTDRGGNGFVGGLCQVAATYQELFAAQGPAGAEKLAAFARELGGRYFVLVERRLAQEQGGSDNSLLVRALDRFHRRLQAPGALLAAAGLSESATEIVERVARERLSHHLQGLRAAFLSCLTDVRQALAAPRLAGKEGPSLAELLANVASSILSPIKASLASVHLFTAKEVSFSNKPYFRVCLSLIFSYSFCCLALPHPFSGARGTEDKSQPPHSPFLGTRYGCRSAGGSLAEKMPCSWVKDKRGPGT